MFAVGTSLLALALFLIRFGYDFAVSDQDEWLPLVYVASDDGMFATDWYVQTQREAGTVRRAVVHVVSLLGSVMPVWLGVLLLHLTSFLLIAAAVYAIALRLVRDRLAAALAVLLVLVLTPKWTLGGNDLAHNIFVPSMAGWALGLWGIGAWVHGRASPAGLLVGLAAWMQPLIALQLGGIVWIPAFVRAVRNHRARRTLLTFSAAWLVAALPALLPLLRQALAPTLVSPDALFYWLVPYRHPHHYLPSAFPLGSYAKVAFLLAVGLANALLLAHRGRLHEQRFLIGAVLVIAAYALAGFVATEISPTLIVAKLQLFKATVLLKVLAVSLIAGGVVALLPAPLVRLLRSVEARPVLLAAPAGLLIALTLSAAFGGPSVTRAPITPRGSDQGDWTAVERWARVHTDTTALFAVPPSNTTFRSRAQRSIVVDFKAFPFQDTLIPTWQERLQAVAPHPLPVIGGADLLSTLDDAYERQPVDALRAWRTEYGVEYAIRRHPLPDGTVPVVFRTPTWIVYGLAPLADRAGPIDR